MEEMLDISLVVKLSRNSHVKMATTCHELDSYRMKATSIIDRCAALRL